MVTVTVVCYSTLHLKFIYLKITTFQHHNFKCVIQTYFKIHDIQVSIENIYSLPLIYFSTFGSTPYFRQDCN